MKKKKPKKLRISQKRNRLIREMAKGKSMAEAARLAGYSHRQNAYNALQNAREAMPEVIERLGYSDELIITRYLQPLLEAKKTTWFQYGGIVMDKRVEPNDAMRHAALDTLLRLKNKYPNKLEIEQRAVVVHVLTEAEREEARASLKLIKSFEEADALESEVVDAEVVES